ncbi:MAG: M48 family metalloprotease [Clostridiales bacterium]|nr:M48 family metalloprotease [Clostridiales bacterium]
MNKIKSFYVFDFLKNFFKWHNVPMMVYLLMNLLFIYIGTVVLVSGAIMAYYDENLAEMLIDVESKEFYLITAAIIAVIYFLAICISLSPVGEWLLRKKLHCDIIQDEYIKKRICPIFQEVYLAACEKSPAISDDIKIFIQQSDDENAFAVGRRSICITTGLLCCSDDEIRGTLGHEFGHLAHKDTDMNLVVNIANWMTNKLDDKYNFSFYVVNNCS